MIYTKRLPKLDLQESLYDEIKNVISQNELIFTAKSFAYDNKIGKTWFEILLINLGFGKKGKLLAQILPDTTRDRIIQFYKPLIDRIGQPYKIRIKSIMNSRFLLPHSDKLRIEGNVSTGDSCSISIGIVTNGETTCFYECPKGFRYSLFHYLKLKRTASIQIEPRQAYMYNNNALHAVYGCRPTLHRHILVISWQDIEIDELNQAVLDIYGE